MTITKSEHIDTLKIVLACIELCDAENPVDYDRREQLVYAALYEAKMAGFQCGLRIDPTNPEWPAAYIELPTGQISWHMPQHVKPYDRHTTEEKYKRIDEWIK